MDKDAIKREVAHTVVDRVVKSGMRIGLGTGSTAIHAVRRVGELLTAGTISDILAVPTSFESRLEAERLGIPLRTLNDADIGNRLDLSIDGADEVDTRTGHLIKGGGAAQTLEKLVEYNSARLYVVVDDSKLSTCLGSLFRIPVEVIPAALQPVRRRLEVLLGPAELRMARRKAGPVITDNGNLILDVASGGGEFDAVTLEREINAIPGVLENGLFTAVPVEVWAGYGDGRVEQILIGI